MSDATPANKPSVATTLAGETFDALASKAGLIWISRVDAGPQPVWFVWHDAAIHLVVGADEQPDPFDDPSPDPSLDPSTEPTTEGERAAVWVTVPSKDTGGSAMLAHTCPEFLIPGSAEWEAAAAALAAKRLNTTTGDLVQHWRTGQHRVVRLLVTEVVSDVANDAVGGRAAVSVEQVEPRRWRPMRAHARRNSARR